MTATRHTREMATPTQVSGTGLLTFALWFGFIDSIAFGALLLLAPAYLVETLIESVAFPYFAVRWAGGVLIALALANWFMLKNPKGQLTLMTVLATSSLLAGAGMTWSWLADEYTGNTWMLVTMLIGTLGLSAVQWLARYRTKDLLTA